MEIRNFALRAWKEYFSTLEGKFHISVWPCIISILYTISYDAFKMFSDVSNYVKGGHRNRYYQVLRRVPPGCPEIP